MENFNLNREERILNSLDGIQKTGAPDFFYTRLSGRMLNEFAQKRKNFFVLKPVFAAAALSVILIINVFFLTQSNSNPAKESVVDTKKPASIESFVKAYDMGTASVYE